MRTVSGPTGIVSRKGPFIIIGLVRLTRCTVIESRWRHAVTSMTPGPDTSTAGGSFEVHATRFRSSRPWSGDITSQNVRPMSQGT